MKFYKLLAVLALFSSFQLGCKKEEDIVKSEKFILLTSHTWTSETLEVDGADASGPDGLLRSFVGDVIFYENGTGQIGAETGSWKFKSNETQLEIYSPAIGFPVTMDIVELSETRLEITTVFPSATVSSNIRMVYVPK